MVSGIIDLFPPTLLRPVRIEFFGDEVESLRTFDQETQRSLNPIASCVIGPAREALPVRGPQAAQELAQLDSKFLHRDADLGEPGGVNIVGVRRFSGKRRENNEREERERSG